MPTGIELIANERKRQIYEEGFDIKHDDNEPQDSLEEAAFCYQMAIGPSDEMPVAGRDFPWYRWPWSASSWNPKDRLRNLIRAGALYMAAAERAIRLGQLSRSHSNIDDITKVAIAIDKLLYVENHERYYDYGTPKSN